MGSVSESVVKTWCMTSATSTLRCMALFKSGHLIIIDSRLQSLSRGLQKEELVLLTHGDSVDKVADGFKVVAQSGNIIAGIYCN